METKITVKGFDWREAALYLVLTASKSERGQLHEEFHGILPTRLKSSGAHPGITRAEVKTRKLHNQDQYKSLFKRGHRTPNETDQRKLLALCLKRAIITAMQNHAYSFGNQARLQEDGGSIGERFTQALARVVMLWWDKKYKSLAQQNNVNLLFYKRYVDDVNQAMTSLPLGTRWSEEERKMIVMQEHIENDKLIASDARTLKEVLKMGNSVCEMIQLTGECPSASSNSRLPVLDLECWVGDDQTIWWRHYRKPVANFLVMLENSAMPLKIKRTVLTQEVMTRSQLRLTL